MMLSAIASSCILASRITISRYLMSRNWLATGGRISARCPKWSRTTCERLTLGACYMLHLTGIRHEADIGGAVAGGVQEDRRCVHDPDGRLKT
jgi:hypothetical protein